MILTEKPFFIGPYLISPHPEAPHFTDPDTAALLFSQVVNEAMSANFNPNQEAVALIRELGLASLFFLVNAILAPFGPYVALDDSLSLDMCNFRQSEACLRPGARAAGFMPRGFSKSRVFTTGGGTFDLLRDPNEQMIIVNAISDKSQEFFSTICRNFDSNDLMKFFYPEFCTGKKGKVTEKEMILPNRIKHLNAPSLTFYGLTGAAEGGHFSTILADDLVGLDAVDSGYQSNAAMNTAKKWFNTNMEALRLTLASREIVVATRYALDDCYEGIYKSCKSLTGWEKGDIVPVQGGEWDIYYRLVEEDGIYLRPDVMDEVHLASMMRNDPVAAMLNYYNSPTKTGLAEFAEATLQEAQLFVDREENFFLRQNITNFSDEVLPNDIPLSKCDVLMSSDLAATEEKGAKAKTCRSSVAIWVVDWYGNYYRIWSKVGYFDIYKSIGFMFEGCALFKGLIRQVIVEANAFQRILKKVIEREMEIREKYIPVVPVLAQGDKKARIRTALGMRLAREKIWMVRGADKEFREELKVFPMSDTRLDVLDESEKALAYLIRPDSPEEDQAWEEAKMERDSQAVNIGAMGY